MGVPHIGSRTLFKGIATLEPSSTVCAEMNGALTFTRNRSLSNLDSQTSADLIGDTIAAFESAVGRVMRESPFVSLSGGIDSRTVVVAAVHKGFRPACISMASSSRSRDALQAAAVCAALHLDHEIVSLSGTFRNQLPELVARAAEITGGVDCVAQAADMFT